MCIKHTFVSISDGTNISLIHLLLTIIPIRWDKKADMTVVSCVIKICYAKTTFLFIPAKFSKFFCTIRLNKVAAGFSNNCVYG